MKNYINLFQPKKPLTENHPVQNGIITINEALPAGSYEFGVYKAVSAKGNDYFRGTIKPAFKKAPPPFSEPKEVEIKSNFNDNLDDDIPF